MVDIYQLGNNIVDALYLSYNLNATFNEVAFHDHGADISIIIDEYNIIIDIADLQYIDYYDATFIAPYVVELFNQLKENYLSCLN